MKKNKNEIVELKEHNLETYNKVVDLFKKHDRVAVVQATGTGKTYLIAKLVEQNLDKKIFIGSPSKYINNQFEDIFPNLMKRVEFYTYSKLLHMKQSDFINFKFDIIVLDEFHRLGAKEWGRAINRILDANEGAKVFGTTATHIRYLDNEKNMVNELFNGVCANALNLGEAIRKKILPKPRLVKALYDISFDKNRLIEKINEGYNSPEQKLELVESVKNISNNFSEACNIKNILKKYIENERKIIVFCDNLEHMNLVKSRINQWLREAFEEDVNIYEIHSKKQNSRCIIKEFELAIESGFHVLLTVNMLNEGLHIEGVDCAILLRNTVSPIIYYQQIGRVLTANVTDSPLIFDLVNNSDNIMIYETKTNIRENSKEIEINREENELIFDVYDETEDFLNKLLEIEEFIDMDWDVMFNELVEHIEKYGDMNNTKINKKLNIWVKRQRYNKSTMSKERVEKLDSIGFVWDYINDIWGGNFCKLVEFVKINGHADVSKTNCDDKVLLEWVKTQRYRYKTGEIKQERIDRLNSIGFSWNYLDDLNKKEWYEMLVKLIGFKSINGHLNVSSRYKDDKKLANWVQTQRKRYKIGKLEEYKIEALKEIGFDFYPAGRKKN